MKRIKYILAIILGFQLGFTACQDDNSELGQLITPSNLDVTFEVVGVDTENLYGDGSGLVNFTATADNEITYNFNFGDGKDNKIDADGVLSYRFSKPGVNTYDVTVLAVGTGGLSASKTIQVEVYSSFTDDEAIVV